MPAKQYIYRHKSVARFQITGDVGERPFDFKNNILRISEGDDALTDARNERFLDLVGQLHPRDRMQIVKMNPEAAAAMESALGPRVVRGAHDTGMIRGGIKGADGVTQQSQAEVERQLEEQRKNDEEARLREEIEQKALHEAAQIAADNAEKERLARIEADEAEQRAKAQGEADAAAAAAAAAAAEAESKTGLKQLKK